VAVTVTLTVGVALTVALPVAVALAVPLSAAVAVGGGAVVVDADGEGLSDGNTSVVDSRSVGTVTTVGDSAGVGEGAGEGAGACSSGSAASLRGEGGQQCGCHWQLARLFSILPIIWGEGGNDGAALEAHRMREKLRKRQTAIRLHHYKPIHSMTSRSMCTGFSM
jgi:hypothetical protein